MGNGKECYDSCSGLQPENFTNGIINGAQWYPLYGGMQDWMYENTNCMEITLELGCNQYPPASMLSSYWQKNKRALINYLKEVHRGVKGFISDALTGSPLHNVTIHVANRTHNVSTSVHGDYFKILLPGFYDIEYELDGYEPERVFASVDSTLAQIINIKMRPIGSNIPHSIINPKPQSSIMEIQNGFDGSQDKTRPLIVANLVLTIIALIAIIAAILGFVMVKTKFFQGRSMSMEMHPTRSSGTTMCRQQALAT